jgi:hypothetical protein
VGGRTDGQARVAQHPNREVPVTDPASADVTVKTIFNFPVLCGLIAILTLRSLLALVLFREE